MKRSRALTPLSHDHQHGLAVALELTRATDESAAAAADGFLAFWRTEGAHHFRIEEEVLLPGAAAHVPPDHEAVERVLSDHREIREQASALGQGAWPPVQLHALGERLRDHIRHEERVLFPLVEEALPPEELSALGERIARAEAER